MQLLLLTVFTFGVASAALDGIGMWASVGMDPDVMPIYNVIPSPFSSPIVNVTTSYQTMFFGPAIVLTLNGTYVYFISSRSFAFDSSLI